MNLTISQALRRIKKLKGQLGEYQDRAVRAVSHKVDEPPAFDFLVSVEGADRTRAELLELETAVAVANAKTAIEFGGKPMLLALAVRTLAELKSEISWYKGLPSAARKEYTTPATAFDGASGRHVAINVAHVCALPEAARATRVEALQTTFDKLNDVVETANHTTHVG